jgi:hypothetical protein
MDKFDLYPEVCYHTPREPFVEALQPIYRFPPGDDKMSDVTVASHALPPSERDHFKKVYIAEIQVCAGLTFTEIESRICDLMDERTDLNTRISALHAYRSELLKDQVR